MAIRFSTKAGGFCWVVPEAIEALDTVEGPNGGRTSRLLLKSGAVIDLDQKPNVVAAKLFGTDVMEAAEAQPAARRPTAAPDVHSQKASASPK